MRTEFVPRGLLAAKEKIKKQHPGMDEVTAYQADEEFLNQIRMWSQMDKDSVETEASVISMHHVKKLARYLPENVLQVPARNLTRIILLRATKEIVQLLFVQWQDFYENKDLCFLLYRIMKEKEGLAENIFSGFQLSADMLMKWLKSADISYAVGNDCAVLNESRRSFPDRMRARHISPNSRLGRSCSERFLTFCTREDYLDYNDQDMKFVLVKYTEQSIRLFLKNILEKLEVRDFQAYYFCGNLLRDQYTGPVNSERYKKFFRDFSEAQELKYKRWQNYILVKDSFTANSGDERLQFWSQYVPYSVNAYRNGISESLVIEFECYSVVEFTTETMGPLYIYQKNIFNKYIRSSLKKNNNQELRHTLYNELKRYCVERIVHSDGWQIKTSRYLTTHSIIS